MLGNIFKKEMICDNCGTTFNKKEKGIYDASHQGRITDGYELKVCPTCMVNLIVKQFNTFTNKAIIIKPTLKHKSYVFYQFESMDKTNKEDEILVSDLKSFLPHDDSKCNKCNSVATYTWCSPEILNNDPYSWEVNNKHNFSYTYLCKKCLSNEFKKEVESNNVKFKFFYPPITGDGFCTQWDL